MRDEGAPDEDQTGAEVGAGFRSSCAFVNPQRRGTDEKHDERATAAIGLITPALQTRGALNALRQGGSEEVHAR